MRYNIFIFCLSSILLVACTKTNISSNTTTAKVKTEVTTPSTYIKVTAKDLSEDTTVLSSKNDELILLMYTKLDRAYPELIVSKMFVMDRRRQH